MNIQKKFTLFVHVANRFEKPGLVVTQLRCVGGDRARTDDLMRAKHTFYLLNYTPTYFLQILKLNWQN